MRLLSHFPAIGISNTYIVGPIEGGDALLVDPGNFDVALLELIEDNGYDIRAVLISHDHKNHIDGLRTLLRIYKAEIFAGTDHVAGFPAQVVKDGNRIKAAGIEVEILNVKGHSTDSRVYRVGPYMFTGDILSAGRVGTSPSSHGRELMIQSIREKILTRKEDLLILPGHGPPTTIEAEKRWNPEIQYGSKKF